MTDRLRDAELTVETLTTIINLCMEHFPECQAIGALAASEAARVELKRLRGVDEERRNASAQLNADLMDKLSAQEATIIAIRDLVCDRVDIVDGTDGPKPNIFMQIESLCEAALSAAKQGTGGANG